MKNRLLKKDYIYIIVACFVFALFLYISYKTPLAGDDWGYYINGSKENPITMAFKFYFSWSGRFFSELWGFVMTHHKMLWNIINSLLFAMIFIGIYKLAGVKNKKIIIPLLIVAGMLSVDDQLRMETYTWIMGSTYVLPLCLSIWYFIIVEKLYIGVNNNKKFVLLVLISNIFLFIIGLMMENIAVAMVYATVVLCIYMYFKKRELLKCLLLNLATSSASLIIMRSSPGSNFRLLRDNAEWANSSIISKITGAFPSFINNTFINNNYLILLLSISIILLVLFTKKRIHLTTRLSVIFVSVIGIIEVFSFALPFINQNHDGNSVFSMVFWTIYTITIIATLFICLSDGFRRDKALFFFTIAGTCSIAMLLSPIYGSRSSLYTVYYIILVISLVVEEIPLQKVFCIFMLLISIYIVGDRTFEYLYKYNLVGEAYNERIEIINYYKDHPNEDAWIPRFPIYTVHGADIEIGDTYHFEVFKEYFGLSQDIDRIFFYYKEN